MFAYCQNNPIAAADANGEWINVVIGAIVGGLIGGIVTAVETYKEEGQINWGRVAVSTATGAISGGFAATGIGGLAAQVAVGAATSFIDSSVQNYCSYKNGKMSLGEAITSTVCDTVMGAAFSAVGFEGSGAFKQSCKISKAGTAGIKTCASRLLGKAVNPGVMKTAKKALRTAGRYALRTLGHEGFSGLSSTAVSYGVKKYCVLAYNYFTR